MADRKITLRRNNSGTSEAMYPTTTVDQIYSSDGATAAFENEKLKYSFLPDGIVGGLKFIDTLAAAEIDSNPEFAGLMDFLFNEYGVEGMPGSYYIASESIAAALDISSTQAGSTGRYYSSQGVGQSAATGEEEPDDTTQLELETGDWLIVTAVTGSGTSGSPYVVSLGVVNNTYQAATASVKGVVELATNSETSTGTDTTRAVTPAGLASVLSGYVTTDTNTTYSTSAVDSGNNAIIRLTGSDSTTDDITLVAGTNMTITPSGDNITLAATDTNDYLDGITKSSNTLTFSVGSQSDVSYTFGSNAFTSTTIPSVTLNGSATTTPSFYAATASGTAGSSSVSRQALFSAGSGNAPTFVDAPKIFYDTTTGWLHGDIVLDVDA
jgi:hypothetical protein